jgi:hypothetical protein
MKLLPAVATLALLAPLSAARSQEDGPTGYVHAAQPGTSIYNLQDDKGSVVHRPAAGSLLGVYRDTGRWLEVEVPGGYAVWVFGRYLAETGQADVCRVNGDGVNLRPSPKTGVENFPLSQQLYTGDQVRVIERADASLPLAEDWVRVWSPPGVRAWIEKDATKPMEAGEDGAALWKAALAALPAASERAAKAKGVSGKPTEAAAAKPVAPAEGERFDAALQIATNRADAERAKETPDWAAVRSLYADAQATASDGAQLAQVRSGLKALEALEEASLLRARLNEERRRREEAARLEQERVWAQGREIDPLGGVFLVRGALERVVTGAGDAAQRLYYLKFGSGTVAEVTCGSGRYDLDLFVGYEVGLRGSELPSTADDGLRYVEVTSLEVIARRP